MALMEGRRCEQCCSAFTPPREHSRFCSGTCLAAWNKAHARDGASGESVLRWSVAAMREVTGRLLRGTARDQDDVRRLVTDAVWSVTIVDARLVRHYRGAYGAVLAACSPAGRRLT
jgi:hypothetical protein